MKYELKIIVLENCPYSIAAVELLENYNISFKKTIVTQETKFKYKTPEIDTFPQVFMNDILLGGYNDINEIINIINSSSNLKIIKNKIMKKYNKLNERSVLRIIQLFMKHNI
jgi:glutaredoxin